MLSIWCIKKDLVEALVLVIYDLVDVKVVEGALLNFTSELSKPSN